MHMRIYRIFRWLDVTSKTESFNAERMEMRVLGAATGE
jgi:hypothetical protein